VKSFGSRHLPGSQGRTEVTSRHLFGDPERLARFEREAKLLASLNHPNIATIYGLEQAEGKRFLAMELSRRNAGTANNLGCGF